MTPEAVLEVTELAKHYRQGEQRVEVLSGVSLQVAAGETLAITGVSGSGKSTLLHLLAGLDVPDAGRVKICGHELSELGEDDLSRLRNRHLGFIYQFHHLLPEFTACENVAMPLMIGGYRKASALQQAAVMLDRVGLSHRLEHQPAALSGGERQRAAIARALVNEPDLVLADEPTGNLDEHSTGAVNELMLSLARDLNVAFVVVTHNPALAGSLDRQLFLHGGQLNSPSS